jgi:hypothetical protein
MARKRRSTALPYQFETAVEERSKSQRASVSATARSIAAIAAVWLAAASCAPRSPNSFSSSQ